MPVFSVFSVDEVAVVVTVLDGAVDVEVGLQSQNVSVNYGQKVKEVNVWVPAIVAMSRLEQQRFTISEVAAD